MTGDYDVVIVAKAYDPGYRPDNTKTVTIAFTNKFTLISNNDTPTPSTWVFGGVFPIKLS